MKPATSKAFDELAHDPKHMSDRNQQACETLRGSSS
jgi:hypothetical protein